MKNLPRQGCRTFCKYRSVEINLIHYNIKKHRNPNFKLYYALKAKNLKRYAIFFLNVVTSTKKNFPEKSNSTGKNFA